MVWREEDQEHRREPAVIRRDTSSPVKEQEQRHQDQRTGASWQRRGEDWGKSSWLLPNHPMEEKTRWSAGDWELKRKVQLIFWCIKLCNFKKNHSIWLQFHGSANQAGLTWEVLMCYNALAGVICSVIFIWWLGWNGRYQAASFNFWHLDVSSYDVSVCLCLSPSPAFSLYPSRSLCPWLHWASW